LTKLGKFWNPIDLQGHMSRPLGQMFRQGDTPRFALPLLNVKLPMQSVPIFAGVLGSTFARGEAYIIM
jgi:hypothetical protein